MGQLAMQKDDNGCRLHGAMHIPGTICEEELEIELERPKPKFRLVQCKNSPLFEDIS
jgi:hypothetical protein